ncbi:TonB-dependent receptor [Chryseolinea sp. T2]|uniref:TonB-dependent receptor n=1 Tax=Chryseolinea sp. T2 TaxID=3129255 RepID=UPI003077F3B3
MKNKSKPIRNALLFFMKVTLINILITSVSVMMAYAIDTNGQEVLDRRVTLHTENAEVKAVLSEIERKVDVKFTYRSKLIQNRDRVSLDVKDETLSTVLDQLLGTNLRYDVIGKQIVLKSAEGDTEPSAVAIAANAPPITVSGVVNDEQNQPIPGVNILVKGTTSGTTTDVNGKFSLDVPEENSTLVFSFIGYASQEVAVAGQTNLTVTLIQDVQSLQEVVVVGYGEQKKITVTGSVVAVNGADLVKSPAVDLSNSFAGRLAGVVAVQTSGEPGNDQSTIRIRGVNTMGNTSPLVVIDGIPDRDGGLNRLAPQDIENISVLKDASSAIYGSRAANGVILVTTKRGKAGAPQVSYDFNQGWSQPTRIPKMSSAPEYAAIMNEIPIYKVIPSNEWNAAWTAIQESGKYTSTNGTTVNANYSPNDVKLFKDGSDPWGHPNTDWFKDAFKTWAPQSRHNLQVSGGNESVKYLASIGYVHQDAYYKNSATFYNQYNFRVNLDAKINKYISTSFGLMAREEDRNYPTQSAGSIFRMLMRGRPTEPEVWPNGLPGPDIENGQNPYVITTNATGYDRTPKDFIQSNARVDITNPWIEGLKLTVMGALDKTIERRKMFETPWYLYTWDKVSYEADGVTPKLTKALRSTFTDARLTETTGSVVNTNLTGLLSYDKTFGEHVLGIMVGTTRETFEGDRVTAYRRDYISTALDQPFFGGTTQLISGGEDTRYTYNRARLGYYGRVTYNYKEKYLAEFVWRYDGSSFFAPSSRYGFFPGVLLGWNISNENFFANALPAFNFLKLRGSYGQMGGDQIYRPNPPPQTGYTDILMEYAYLSLYSPNSYPINNQVVTTLLEGTAPNVDYTWEVSNNANVGLEGIMFNNKFDFTLEYFINRRNQMLIYKQGSTPESTGLAARLPPVNAGKMENKGFEFTLGYNGQSGNFMYRIGVNAGYNKNKVIYMDEVTSAPSYQWQTGHQLNAYLAYKADGAFLSQAEIDQESLDYSAVTSKLLPGDMKFQDVNNDGKINADDKVRLDKSDTPNFNYGITMNFTFMNFDLAILFQGAAGALLPFGTESGDIGNYLKYSHDHRWTIDNPSSVNPRLAIRNDTYYTGGEYSINTYYLYSKNYLRLKNIELGYNVPRAAVGKIGLSALRIYVNGLNLVTWDKYKIFDPETTSGSGQYYPQSRIINTGVRLTF